MMIKIGDIEIGKRVLIIAEIGNNHNGDYNRAEELLLAAAKAGVDAVKFQTFQAKHLVISSMPTVAHARGFHKTQRERMESLQFNHGQWVELKNKCDDLGLMFLSTPFDEESADLLESLVPAYKIASGDMDNLPLIRHVVKKNKPLIVSTGMSDLGEIDNALSILPKQNTILLHCVSKYPTPLETANLRSIPFIKERFRLPTGYSDHTIGNIACEAAAALGAVVLEKHFTLDKSDPIGDHKLSADQDDMKRLVENVRQIEKALGSYERPVSIDIESRKALRRSIYAGRDIRAGEIITREDLAYLRPPDGMPPSKTDEIVGRRARTDIQRESLIDLEMIDFG